MKTLTTTSHCTEANYCARHHMQVSSQRNTVMALGAETIYVVKRLNFCNCAQVKNFSVQWPV